MKTKQKPKPKPNSFDVLVGENLRNIRKFKAVSQGDLAVAIGVSFQQVQKYEKGENRISATRLYKAAQYLETDLMQFFNGYKKQSKGSAAIDLSLDMDKQTYKLLKIFKKIEDKALRRAVLKILEKLAA